MKSKIKLLAIICIFLGINSQLFAQVDGARAYWPIPRRTNVITPVYTFISSNKIADNNLYYSEGDFTTQLGGLQLTRAFSLKGHTATFTVYGSYGYTEGETSGDESFKAGKTSGLGDIYGAFSYNLIGSPGVTPEEFMKAKYDWVVDLQIAAKASVNYNEDKYLNVGSNRWEIRAGFPIMKFQNWGTIKQSSFEVFPSFSYYTTNVNPSKHTDSDLKQSPTFNLDAHYTRNFNKILWAAGDIYYVVGGETSYHANNDDDQNDDTDIADVIYNNDLINSIRVGVTVGGNFTRRISARANFGQTFSINSNGIAGSRVQVSATYAF